MTHAITHATQHIRTLAKSRLWITVGTVLMAAGVMTHAHAAPDAVAGKAKAAQCVACHGENGISPIPGFPHLAAQPYLSSFYQLLQFRDERRKGGGMEAIAKGLSEDDMRDLSAHFASLPPPPAQKSDAADKIALGQKLAQQNFCASCHGAKFQGQKHVARLSGQSTEYFTAQLKALRSGARADMDGTMASAAKALTDEAIEALATYAKTLD
jgi:cytochrome c553